MTCLGEVRSQLREVGRAKTPGPGPLLLDGTVAYVLARTSLCAVDVADPAHPAPLWTLPFKSHLAGLARQGKDLWVGESNRALNAVDVSDGARPIYRDCLVLLGHSIAGVARVDGERLLVGGDRGLLLVEPGGRRPSIVARLGLGTVQDFSVDGPRVFVALGTGGLKVARVDGDRLTEESQPLPRERFFVESAHLVDGQVHCHGSARKGNANLVVLDRADPSREVFRGQTGASAPRQVLQVGGRAVGFNGYKCWVYEAAGGKARLAFSMYRTNEDDQYMEVESRGRLEISAGCCDDVVGFDVRDGFLYASQGEELVVYAVNPGSVFGE